jgi:N utilization substance protein B
LSRTLARELAFKVLYQQDLVGGDPEEQLLLLCEETPLADRYRRFAADLVEGTLAHIEAIDAHISRYSPEWSLQRMAVVDRNIMRLAAYELLYSDLDPAIVINEAVEMAKRYGDENSRSFVNAILDKIMGDAQRGSRPGD